MLRLHTADAPASGTPAAPRRRAAAGVRGGGRGEGDGAVAERVRALRAELRALGASVRLAPAAAIRRDPVARLLGGRAALTELLPDPDAPHAPPPWGFAAALAAAAVRDAADDGGDESGGDGNGDGNGGGVVAVVSRGRGGPFPPAWAARGVRRVIWVRPATERDRLWALERCLRCGGLAATVGFLPDGRDDVTGRRLALAAAAGGGRGVLLRPAAAARRACWADVRLACAPAAGPGVRLQDSPRVRWRVRVLRRRGAVADDLERGLTLELTDDATLAELPPEPAADHSSRRRRRDAGPGALRLPAGLAGPADPRRPADPAGLPARVPVRRRGLARAG